MTSQEFAPQGCKNGRVIVLLYGCKKNVEVHAYCIVIEQIHKK
jgi:hypothetical protein